MTAPRQHKSLLHRNCLVALGAGHPISGIFTITGNNSGLLGSQCDGGYVLERLGLSQDKAAVITILALLAGASWNGKGYGACFSVVVYGRPSR